MEPSFIEEHITIFDRSNPHDDNENSDEPHPMPPDNLFNHDNDLQGGIEVPRTTDLSQTENLRVDTDQKNNN